uniref:Syntaxin 17 n=1 Tax=Macaca fascicularis TaxID=9541 RepID=A0A7N9CQF6_MACFA
MQLKTKLQDYWCQHVYPNEDLCCCWTLHHLLEHKYIKIVATDVQVGLKCDKWIYFVVAGVFMEMLEIEALG